MRELDQRLQECQKQLEEHCEQELEDAKITLDSDNVLQDSSSLRFSNKVAIASKTCEDIANEKISLATQTYTMVDNHIQRLDKYLKKFEEELRRESEIVRGSVAAEQRIDASGRVGKESDTKTTEKKLELEQPVSMDLDLPIDPNEPTYCYCNQVSFGNMVACDNPDCKIEWFHFECVGIKERPKGKWYCPDCAAFNKRHRKR